MSRPNLWPRADPSNIVEYASASPSYTVVPSQVEAFDTPSRKDSRNLHNYVPFPLRLPFLATFVCIFGLCIMLIELAISKAEIPALDSSSSTSTPAAKLNRIKRQDSALSPRSIDCDANDQSVLWAEYSTTSSSLCYIYTVLGFSQYKTTTIPADQLSSVSLWVADMQTVNGWATSLSQQSTSCSDLSTTFTTFTGFWETQFVGCDVSSTFATGCWQNSQMILENNQITTISSGACPAYQSMAMTETSQARTEAKMMVVATSSNAVPGSSSTAAFVSATFTSSANPSSTSQSASGTITQSMAAPSSETQASASSSVSRAPQPTGVLSSHEQVIPGAYHAGQYFAALYAAPLLAVLIKVLWSILYASIRLVQPFERMNTQHGASGDYSLFAQYLSSSILLDAFKSLGHYNVLPLLASFTYLIVQLGTPLASISMTVKSFDICLIDGQNLRCNPRWVINEALLRTVEATLWVCMLTVVAIAIVIRWRRPGIASDPSSVASISALFNHEPLLRAIQTADRNTDGDSFKRDMDQYRFHMGYHRAADGTTRYGIMSSLGDPIQGNRQHYSGGQIEYYPVDRDTELATTGGVTRGKRLTRGRITILSRILSHPLMDLLGLFFPASLLALILAFQFDPHVDRYNDFFNGLVAGQHLPKFLLVGLATLSALTMSRLERTVRITDPFRRLAANRQEDKTSSSNKRSLAPPETTLLIDRSGTAWSSLPGNISLLATHELRGGRMTFQTLTAAATILADLNIIAVTGVAYTEATTMRSYALSSAVSIALTATLVLVVLVLLVWWRRNPAVKAVRESGSGGAETIGGVMRYLGGQSETIDEVTRYHAAACEDKRLRRMRTKEGGRGWFGRRVYFGPIARAADYRSDDDAGIKEEKEKWSIRLQVTDELEQRIMTETTEYKGKAIKH